MDFLAAILILAAFLFIYYRWTLDETSLPPAQPRRFLRSTKDKEAPKYDEVAKAHIQRLFEHRTPRHVDNKKRRRRTDG